MEDFEKIRSSNPSNLICCDCSQKLPSNINITVGAFVCMKCATLLQKLQKSLKIVKICPEHHLLFSCQYSCQKLVVNGRRHKYLPRIFKIYWFIVGRVFTFLPTTHLLVLPAQSITNALWTNVLVRFVNLNLAWKQISSN